MKQWILLMAAVGWLFASTVASAQDADDAQPQEQATDDDQPSTAMDEEARALFIAGERAFSDARYEDALAHFRRAYELSRRPVLFYNIGISADRLRRDREALEAFERFVAEVDEHPRRRDAEVRLEVLRRELENQPEDVPEGDEPEDDGGGVAPLPTDPEAPRDSGPGVIGIVGPAALGAVGLAGIVAAVVGMAAGGCQTEDLAGSCIEERQTAWGPVALFGGLGVAAVAGAVVWLLLSLGGDDSEATADATRLRWSF